MSRAKIKRPSIVWQYVKNVLIAVDQLANTIAAGAPDETLSSRCYRAAEKGYPFAKALRWLLDAILSPGMRDHCYQSFLSEKLRRQLPADFWRKP